MTTETSETPARQQTEHPHIVCVEVYVEAGQPLKASASLYVTSPNCTRRATRSKRSYRRILNLEAAAVYNAISYYLDHQQAIEREIGENRLEAMTVKYNLEMNERGFLHFPATTPTK